MSGLRRARQIVAARLEDFFTVPVIRAGFVDGCFRWADPDRPAEAGLPQGSTRPPEQVHPRRAPADGSNAEGQR